ncbi:MAG: YjjG family noncanonical pyrimidine nucleotidase [Crocinitomicaceae bacterium]|nr:YjjG family noncanonical pyrimidine nucleotidase [Crocinitomicaceae bacterium]MDG1776465.1 YjjG family noncanonical pyrimidine nucleotidase [Crocinitomicaceae bacterium]
MKHLFFDLDRTLWDFEKNSEIALRAIYSDFELDNHFRSFRFFNTTYKKINAQLWHKYGAGKITRSELRVRRFIDTLKKVDVHNEELAIQLCEGYVKVSPFQTNLFPNAIETLINLKNEGYELHIITNGFKEVQYIKLEKSKLLEYFDVIVCSDEVGKTKPARDIFDYALHHAKAKPSESLMIGDDYLVDVIGAEKIGMQGILFDPNKSYREGTHEWIINNLNEIPELIPWITKTTL